MPDPTAPEPFDEALYEESLQHLRSPRPLNVSSLLFVVLLLVFVVSQFQALRSVSGVVILVGVILFHEAGHALGMRVFGFRDVRMFFIPFFGAAVSGRSRGAATWKEAVVSLLGPLPGIALSLALLWYGTVQLHPDRLTFELAWSLLLINAFNLLPMGFLDGGRFLESVLFSRHRVLAIGFVAAGSVALGLLAVAGRMFLLGFFALTSLLALPARWRILTAAASLRREQPGLPADPDALSELQSRALFSAARSAVRDAARSNAPELARGMEGILQDTRRAPGVGATLGLLTAYAGGFVVVLVASGWLFAMSGPVEWRQHRAAGWSAEFPRAPWASTLGPMAGAPRDSVWRSIVGGVERFTVSVSEGGEDGRWRDSTAAWIAIQSKVMPSGRRPIEIPGATGEEFEFTARNRALRARLFATATRRFTVSASAPRWGENQERFLGSFALGDSAETK